MKQIMLFSFFYIALCQWSSFNTNPDSLIKSDNVGEYNFDISKYKKCDNNCIDCDSGECKQCIKGYYLYKSVCYEACPFDTLADNYSLTCKTTDQTPVFIKAYTISRCLNSCGKIFEDCSCSPKCKKFGNCCTDYKFCDIIEKEKSTKCKVENCIFCSPDGENCLQCKDNFYYYENKCFLKCPKDLNAFEQNKLCYHKCDDVSCEKCEESNKGVCLKCLNGFFLFKGQCLKTCPIETRANKIDFVCNSKKEFSFYWTFPSKSSCKDKCGSFDINNDCSCRVGCMRRGNCCDDFEKQCNEELQKEGCKLCRICIDGSCIKCKEEAILGNNGICRCDSGYFYDIEEDICIKTNLYTQKYFKLKNLEKKFEGSSKIDYKSDVKTSLNYKKSSENKKLKLEKIKDIKTEKNNDLAKSFDFLRKIEKKKEINKNENTNTNKINDNLFDAELEQFSNDNMIENKVLKSDSNSDIKSSFNNSNNNVRDNIVNIEKDKYLGYTNITINKQAKRPRVYNVDIKNLNNKKTVKKEKPQIIDISKDVGKNSDKTENSSNTNIEKPKIIDLSKDKEKNSNKTQESSNTTIEYIKIPRRIDNINDSKDSSKNANNLAKQLLTYFNNIMKLLEGKHLEETLSKDVGGKDRNNNQIMNLYMNGNISINILEGNNHSTLNTNKVVSMNSNNNLSSNSLYNNSYNTISNSSVTDKIRLKNNSGRSIGKSSKQRTLASKMNPHIVSLLDNLKTLHPNLKLKTSFKHNVSRFNKKRTTSREHLMNVMNLLSKRQSKNLIK